MDVLIGRNGFLGRAIEAQADKNLVGLGRGDFNLLGAEIPKITGLAKAKTIIYTADYYPGIANTKGDGATIYHTNMAMYKSLFGFAVSVGASRVITIGTTGCYPVSDEILSEDMFKGLVERLNPKLVSYALSRFSLIDMGEIYEREHGIKHNHLVLGNFYGPGDNFAVGRSHLLGSWVRDFSLAKAGGESELVLWGPKDQQREFIFIDDAARAVLELAKIDVRETVLNVGTGGRVTYEELAHEVLRAIGWAPKIIWEERPVGRVREVLDVTKFGEYGIEIEATPLYRGVDLMVEDFNKAHPEAYNLRLEAHHAKSGRKWVHTGRV